MPALIDRDTRRHLRQPKTIVLLGVDLADAREEMFCRMVCDGLSIGTAYVKAGFTGKGNAGPLRLFNARHIQERARAILEARTTQGVITLPEVTDMLKRVFAGALHDAEYSAAHNAAFSLARLYGHVTDRASIEIIRRPSRDPDAPSEMALGAWVEALPGLTGPGPDGPLSPVQEASFLSPRGPSEAFREASFVRLSDAPATLLGPDTPSPEAQNHNQNNTLPSPEPISNQSPAAGLEPSGPEKLNDINWLNRGTTVAGGRSENGAPARPVTVALQERAHSAVLGPKPPLPLGPVGPRREPGGPTGREGRVIEKRPPPKRQVPVPIRGKVKKRVLKPRIPSAKELFG
jgi:hypothetical protein